MTKGIRMLAAALCIMLAGAASAQATVIYDWITHSTNPYDDGFGISAQWKISDSEYQKGTFTTTPDQRDDVDFLLTLTLPGGALWQAKLYPFFTGIDPLCIGTLSQDRQTISGILYFDPPVQYTNDELWLMATDALCTLTINRIAGSLDPLVSGLGNVWASDGRNPEVWDQNGEWRLREGTQPSIPEPGTVLLMGLGLGWFAYVFYKKGARITE